MQIARFSLSRRPTRPGFPQHYHNAISRNKATSSTRTRVVRSSRRERKGGVEEEEGAGGTCYFALANCERAIYRRASTKGRTSVRLGKSYELQIHLTALPLPLPRQDCVAYARKHGDIGLVYYPPTPFDESSFPPPPPPHCFITSVSQYTSVVPFVRPFFAPGRRRAWIGTLNAIASRKNLTMVFHGELAVISQVLPSKLARPPSFCTPRCAADETTCRNTEKRDESGGGYVRARKVSGISRDV